MIYLKPKYNRYRYPTSISTTITFNLQIGISLSRSFWFGFCHDVLRKVFVLLKNRFSNSNETSSIHKKWFPKLFSFFFTDCRKPVWQYPPKWYSFKKKLKTDDLGTVLIETRLTFTVMLPYVQFGWCHIWLIVQPILLDWWEQKHWQDFIAIKELSAKFFLILVVTFNCVEKYSGPTIPTVSIRQR